MSGKSAEGLGKRIREKAAELGFCKVGFTTMDDLPRASGEAVRRGYPQFFQDMVERGLRPRDLFYRPGHAEAGGMLAWCRSRFARR